MKTIEIKERHYFLFQLYAKFRGDKDFLKEDFSRKAFYDVEIYDVELRIPKEDSNKYYRKYGRNELPDLGKKSLSFQMPKALRVYDEAKDLYYTVELKEPLIDNVKYKEHYHQVEGDEVFGTLTADALGYIETVQLKETFDERPTKPPVTPWPPEGGGTIVSDDDKVTRIISNTRKGFNFWESFFTGIGWVILIALALGFFYILKDIWLIVLLYAAVYGACFALSYLFSWAQNSFSHSTSSGGIGWVWPILGLIFLGVLIFSSFNQNYIPDDTRYVENDRVEFVIDTIRSNNQFEVDTFENNNIGATDSFVQHTRTWKDYKDSIYSITYKIPASAINVSHDKKNDMANRFNFNEASIYNELAQEIKDTALFDLYKQFDSLKISKTKDEFAYILISFVQDIDYTLITDKPCDWREYMPNGFSYNYLRTNQGPCSGGHFFGICSPIEFMGNLEGDCDTRTMFLYALLKKYNYEAAIINSNLHAHSILGVKLDQAGFKNQDYTLFETTSFNYPNYINNQMRSPWDWRIVLK
jgi:uncharacterized membrane protein